MEIRIALAGNPNCGKTTLFNALTGSNQFVGNWPGVTVEKKEGKLKKHPEVTITDLPGIYSLSPYTLEEVVARNYLINQRPDAILNIIDGTNLERNLYLTTQLTELGIPVVVAINMMDVVRKNGDKINTQELSKALGCRVVEISALKGDGTVAAAEAAIDAARNGKTLPMHRFSGPVEHAIAHIEEAAVHSLPEEQQRWYAIKIFERDDKVLAQLQLDSKLAGHIEADIQAAETELDDDAESIITNERYIYIGELIKRCYKKHSAGKLSNSDKIDRVVTNRWLGLPIFAAVMFLVYYIAMVTVGSFATDWANDGVFGDGWHLLGIGSAAYNEAAEEYSSAALIVDGFDAYVEENGSAPTADFIYEAEDEETLEISEETASLADYQAALATLERYGEEPDPAAYGVWVPGIPVLIGNLLEKANAAEWLSGLILDGIVASIGGVLAWVFKPLGWGNWQAAVASITGLVAKETIVGTMGILYGSGDGTVYQNLSLAFTGITGYSFLVFNLLCAPCFAAIGAIKREMNNAKWTWFAIGYQCGFAYAISLMINQFGSALTGNLNVLGLIVALALLVGMLYMLFKPYKEATKLAGRV